MSHRIFRCAACLACTLLLSISAAFAATNEGDWEEVKKPYILIYNGEGAAEGGPEALGLVAKALGHRVGYIADLEELPDALDGAAAFMIGGTEDDTGDLLEALEEVETELKDYIATGGRYLGICGGAYLASLGSDWPQSEGGREDDLGLVAVESFAFDLKNPAPQIITVHWPKGSARSIYYQYGPAFDPKALAAGVPTAKILAWYSTGSVAAFAADSGKGRIALCGPHPEGVEDWLEDDDGTMILNWEKWDKRGTGDLVRQLFETLLAD